MSTDLVEIRSHAIALMIATKEIIAGIDAGRLPDAVVMARRVEEAVKELGDRLSETLGQVSKR
jgi:hypothetical protein